MATFSKQKLSGSTQGKNQKVTGTNSAGAITVHTAVTGTSDLDEIWVWACNTDTVARKLTIEWGETTDPDGTIEITVPAEAGMTLAIPGLLLQNALLVKAFAATANVILLNGYVNRITA